MLLNASMNSMRDAFGQALLACFNHKDGYLIIERDDGYFDADGPEPYFSKYKDWPDHHKRAIILANGRILDIGCGAGRHCLYLQKKGFDIIGVDVSPLAVKVCKLRGLRKARVMSITDIGRFMSNSFDTVLMMGNNFGLFGSLGRARSLLRTLRKITALDGLIVAESMDPYGTENPFHLRYHKLNRKRERMAGQVRIRIRYQKYVGDWFDYLLVSKKEMLNILRGTGWRVKEFIDSRGPQYVAVIEKT